MIKIMTIMSVIGFCIMGVDKYRAKTHLYRVPERTLWLISFFLGAIGCTIGMYFFHHKTRKIMFSIGFPALAIAQIIICML